jgi:hypothetical protein
MGKTAKLPKTECCVSSTRCERCPIRMLKEGTLPEGYGVKKRKLVRVEAGRIISKKVKKSDLAAACRAGAKKKSKLRAA